MDPTDLSILINAAEEVCSQQIQPAEILEGSPQYISNAQTQYIHGENNKEPEVQNKRDDEVREHSDIVPMGRAATEWFSLPDTMQESINLVSRGAVALSQGLNKVREYTEKQKDMKLITARARCEIEFGQDKEYPPRIKNQPGNNEIRLVVKHALRKK